MRSANAHKTKDSNLTSPKKNQELTNPRSVRCFSPDSIPGVSMMEILSRTGLGTLEHWNRLRKALPNFDSGRNCFFGSTTSALPGTTPSVSPYITAMKRSVVGSGPIRRPGKSYMVHSIDYGYMLITKTIPGNTKIKYDTIRYETLL